jgi:hypothetical protein
MQADIELAVKRAGEATASYLTSRLHAAALDAGWPASTAACLSVVQSGDHGVFDVHFPQENSGDVWDQEMETHVILKFLNKVEYLAGAFYLDESLRQLSAVGTF